MCPCKPKTLKPDALEHLFIPANRRFSKSTLLKCRIAQMWLSGAASADAAEEGDDRLEEAVLPRRGEERVEVALAVVGHEP
jgi:hypothetical protein